MAAALMLTSEARRNVVFPIRIAGRGAKHFFTAMRFICKSEWQSVAIFSPKAHVILIFMNEWFLFCAK